MHKIIKLIGVTGCQPGYDHDLRAKKCTTITARWESKGHNKRFVVIIKTTSMKSCALSKTNPSLTSLPGNNDSEVGKKKKMCRFFFRMFRSKLSSEKSPIENYERAQLAERIMKWQQESSREELCTHDVDYAKDIVENQIPEESETYMGQTPERPFEHNPENIETQHPALTSSNDSPLNPTKPMREKQWHEDLVPLAINEGFHSLWIEATKHLPPWLNVDTGLSSTDPTRFLTFPVCGEKR
jgi:hypothetical protein